MYIHGQSILSPEVETPYWQHDDDWFVPADYLGRRGVRTLPRPVQLLAACATLQTDGAGFPHVSPERVGLWVATSSFAESVHPAMDETVISSGADGLSPLQAPYFSVNLIASRFARDHNTRGMVTTVTTPATGFHDALSMGELALSQGRVDELAVACTEVPISGTPGGPDDGCVLLYGSQEREGALASVEVFQGFVPPGNDPKFLLPNTGRNTAPQETAPHQLFTNRSSDDPVLHAIIDQLGGCIDTRILTLGESMLGPALSLSETISSGRGGLVTVVSSKGQWATAQVDPASPTKLAKSAIKKEASTTDSELPIRGEGSYQTKG